MNNFASYLCKAVRLLPGVERKKACDPAVPENGIEHDCHCFSDVVCYIWPKLVDPPALSDSELSLKSPAGFFGRPGLAGHESLSHQPERHVKVDSGRNQGT